MGCLSWRGLGNRDRGTLCGAVGAAMMYKISLDGCDDSTHMEMELTDEQAEFVRQLCKLSEENSSFSCMPTMGIKQIAVEERESEQ